MNEREPRRLFWIGDRYEGYSGVVVPAEVVTDTVSGRLAHLSRYGMENERNERAEQGMWHWHWTVANERLDDVRAVLVELGLEETDDLDAVW